jgi:S-adenosylhomocysteine hydrolase
MEGYEVVLMDEAIDKADIVVTATGNKVLLYLSCFSYDRPLQYLYYQWQ